MGGATFDATKPLPNSFVAPPEAAPLDVDSGSSQQVHHLARTQPQRCLNQASIPPVRDSGRDTHYCVPPAQIRAGPI